MSAGTDCIAGSIRIKSPDKLPTFNPELYTWNIKVTPMNGLTCIGGSLSVSGTASRAKNPVFRLSTPFYSPVAIPSGSMIHSGISKTTGYLACDIIHNSWHLTSFAAPFTQATDPAWIQFSKTITFPSIKEAQLFISPFTGIYRISQNSKTSWFTDSGIYPESVIILPGIEMIAQIGKLSFSCTSMVNHGEFRETEGAIRGDFSFTLNKMTISGGAYYAGDTFIDLDGTDSSIHDREFISSVLSFPRILLKTGTLSFGTLLYTDNTDTDCFLQDYTRTLVGRFAIKFVHPIFRTELACKVEYDCFDVNSDIYIKNLFSNRISCNMHTDINFASSIESDTSLEMTCKATRKFSGSIKLRQETASDKKTIYSETLAAALMINGYHGRHILVMEFAASNNTDTPFNVSIGMKNAITTKIKKPKTL